MEEPQLRSRVSWIVGLVLSAAFVGTIIWSVAQDSDDDDVEDDQVTFDSTGEAIGETTTTFVDVGEPIDPEVLMPDAEDLPEYTLTVHTDGCGVVRSEEVPEPYGLTWVVKDQDGFDVLGRNALGETQYRYFEGGSYTVVLEAWGGDRYVEVSNTVDIAC